MAGQRFGQTDRYLGYGIGHWYPLVIDEVVEEEPDRLEVAGNGLGGELPSHEVIHIAVYLLTGCLVKGHRKPCGKLGKDIQVALHGVGGEVPSL